MLDARLIPHFFAFCKIFLNLKAEKHLDVFPRLVPFTVKMNWLKRFRDAVKY